MKTVRQARPSPALVVAVLALVAAVAGSAVAEVATTARLDKKEKRQVRKISKKQANKRITKRAPNLSVAEAQNATNAQNAENANSANTANTANTANKANNVLSATIHGGCTVARATQPGTTATPASSTAPAASACTVDFSRDVSQCTYVASIGETGPGESSRGFVTTAGASGNPEAVFVRTTNITDALAIRPFQLQVVC